MSCSNKDSASSSNKVNAGRSFERQAAEFYRTQGFAVLEQNWRAGRKEIDLIVRKDNLVIFVEVKSSRSEKFGHPSERVDRRKQENLIDAAQRFINDRQLTGIDFRFDVITYVGEVLEHYPNAFDTTS